MPNELAYIIIIIIKNKIPWFSSGLCISLCIGTVCFDVLPMCKPPKISYRISILDFGVLEGMGISAEDIRTNQLLHALQSRYELCLSEP